MAKFLFYGDVQGFGGHEMMALLIMREMAQQAADIHFACAEGNGKLLAEACRIEGLTVHTLPLSLNRYNFITNPVNLPKIARLRRLLRELNPDCIVAVQGTIEISSLVLTAARREKVPVVTYIALAQSMQELGMPHPRLRDAVDRYYFTLPDRFITIGDSQKRYLLRHGVPERKIAIVPNVVQLDLSRSLGRDRAREALGLERDKSWFGLVGRVVARHKGHDYLVSMVKAHRDLFAAIRFLIVGDGPDLDRIKKTVAREGLGSFFAFIPWTGEMNPVYSALDAVIMPSNHEGVPLVMIEAGLYGLPVVASAIDGMRDYLPAEWLFPRGDLAAMAGKIVTVSSNDQSARCAVVQEKFRGVFLRRTIGEEFLRELEGISVPGRPAEVLPFGAANRGNEPCR